MTFDAMDQADPPLQPDPNLVHADDARTSAVWRPVCPNQGQKSPAQAILTILQNLEPNITARNFAAIRERERDEDFSAIASYKGDPGATVLPVASNLK